MDLSVIILSFNTQRLLKDCLKSIFSQTRGIEYEVIVVDNGSKDGSVAMVKQEFPQLKLIENKKNLGFSQANNQGIKQSRGKWILLLNSDTKINHNALKKLISFAKKKPNLGAVGPRLLNPDSTPQPSISAYLSLPRALIWLLSGDRFLYSSPHQSKEVDWVMGAALMVKKEVIEKVGFLDGKFFMYVEEMEWCYRIKKAGYQIWFYPGAEIFHLVRGASPKGKEIAILGIYKGILYFYQKHFAPWQGSVLKFFLLAKAAGVWLIGFLTNNRSLRETYAKAFRLVR